ncbi:MAG: HAD hydrolase-like protein, partial [Verrucomicrobiota bacterium]
MDYASQLKNLPRRNDYFIGFDSDGCVFDTMELKHKECFCPAVIKHFGVQPVSKAAREVWDFVNLYSKTRGCNRFLAVQHFRDLLRERPDVQSRGFHVPELKELDAWVGRETKLGNPALVAEVEKTGNEELKKLLDWSLEVNERVTDMVFGMTPFPRVMDVLEQGRAQSDMIVISQTPLEALEREWEENGMVPYVGLIAGQEHGTKTEHIRFATEAKGYDPEKVLMVGDAPGDFKAAEENNACFFPIVPGSEEASWKRLAEEGLARFFAGTFAGEYQQVLLAEFDVALPDQ